MRRLICMLLTLLFSLSGPVMGWDSDFGRWSNAAKVTAPLVRVTSWAERGITPDLNPGRWIQLGDATSLNFLKTGLPGPKGYLQSEMPFLKFEGSKVPFANSITADVPASSIQWPRGGDFWRGIFGQRQLKP